ncbi:MAG: class D beta-lactamase [Spirochaetia bacterium]
MQVFKTNVSTQIEALFLENNINATFILYDSDRLVSANVERAKTPFIPASTFKIPHSLIGLTTAVIPDEESLFYIYDGSPVYLSSWARDMNLADAIQTSNVLAYQHLARLIGSKRMKEHLQKLNYGNKEVGNVIDIFWLEGPLKISAIEQVEFLKRLANKTLPYPSEIQVMVAEIIEIDRSKDWILYGKTGWSTIDNIGWFVGWLEKGKSIYPFAFNMDIQSSTDLPKRTKITKNCLNILGLI